jgi:hypothetical protein
MASQQVHRRQAALARQVPSLAVNIELLVIPHCPHVAARRRTDCDCRGGHPGERHLTQTVIATEDEAHRRGFTGSPTILVNGADPFVQPDALVALACQLYSTPKGCEGRPICEICAKHSSG